MKLLLLHHVSNIGGGTRSLIDVASMLKDEFEVEVCAPSEPAWLGDQVRALGLKFIPAPLPMPVFYHYNGMAGPAVRLYMIAKGFVTFNRFRAEWAKALRDLEVDCVAVNSAVLCLFGPIARMADVSAACFVRETFPSPRWSALTAALYAILAKYFSMAIFLSDYDRKQSGLPPDRSVVVPDTLMPGELVKMNRVLARGQLRAGDLPVALFAGGSSRLKGFDTLLAAANRLDGEVNIVVAGTVDVKGRGLLKRLRSLILSPREYLFKRRAHRLLLECSPTGLQLIGQQEDMSLAYSVADMVVFPSRLPHQARPVYEAGFFGVPIVISDFACTREYVAHNVNGLTVRPGDVDALVSAIRLLARNKGLRERLGEANRCEFERSRDYQRVRRVLIGALVGDRR